MVLLRQHLIVLGLVACCCNAFAPPSQIQSTATTSWQASSSSSQLFMSTEEKQKPAKKERYVPKWKKKATLAEATGTAELTPEEKGLVGAIPITFKQGTGEDATLIKTSAMPGQPLKLVASQAGQYIKYGCGKGECGTCEALCNGKYLRPCIDSVPTDLSPDPETGKYATLVIQVKGTKAKVVSSGKFFSVKSFFLGFWNNLLGMGGFVRDRRKAKKNYEERISREEEIKRRTEGKKRLKAEAAAAAAAAGKE
jgi:ferredoxin